MSVRRDATNSILKKRKSQAWKLKRTQPRFNEEKFLNQQDLTLGKTARHGIQFVDVGVPEKPPAPHSGVVERARCPIKILQVPLTPTEKRERQIPDSPESSSGSDFEDDLPLSMLRKQQKKEMDSKMEDGAIFRQRNEEVFRTWEDGTWEDAQFHTTKRYDDSWVSDGSKSVPIEKVKSKRRPLTSPTLGKGLSKRDDVFFNGTGDRLLKSKSTSKQHQRLLESRSSASKKKKISKRQSLRRDSKTMTRKKSASVARTKYNQIHSIDSFSYMTPTKRIKKRSKDMNSTPILLAKFKL